MTLVWPPHQLRQLGDIHRNPPRLIALPTSDGGSMRWPDIRAGRGPTLLKWLFFGRILLTVRWCRMGCG
jgi:hypothetical protein